MTTFRRLAALSLALALVCAPCAQAGLIIENDQSDLCNSNLQDCTSRCAPPQSFIFSCNSGGTFSKPQSDCKCTNPPAPDVVTDGSAILQLIQWPGPQACAGQTWMYDCAQFINMQAIMNNIQASAVDQASAMAAVAAAQAAAQAAAAQAAAAQAAADAAAKQTQAQADPSGLNAPPAAPGTSFGAAPTDAMAGAMPGAMPGQGMGGAGMAPDTGMGGGFGGGMAPAPGAGMGGGFGGGMAPAPGAMPGQGMGGAGMAPDAGMGGGFGGGMAPAPSAGMGGGFGGGMAPAPGAGAGIMGGAGPMAGGAPMVPANSLMGAGQFGRHLLQGSVLGAAPMPASSGTMPSTTLSPACSKPIQGLVTGANTALLAVPNFKGVANMLTRGNDTVFVQLGGASSNCVAAYKLMTGQIMNIGRPAPSSPAAATPPAAKSAAGDVSTSALLLLLAPLLALLL